MSEKPLIGVGLLLFSTQHPSKTPSLLTIRELFPKPSIQKIAQMISFPIETQEERDETIMGTVERLIEEEVPVGIDRNYISEIVESPTILKLFNDQPHIDIRYCFGIYTGTTNFDPRILDSQVKYAGWREIPALLEEFIRIEVKPILDDFFKTRQYQNMKVLFESLKK